MMIAAFSLVVPDYESAIAFYVGMLGFDLLEDTDLGGGKRWVRVAPRGCASPCFLLAKAVGPEQTAAVGRQAGGRVIAFISTDDFHATYDAWTAAGVRFCESPRVEPYGIVAVFQDPFGNRFDLIEPKPGISGG